MMRSYLAFDFGSSLFVDRPIAQMIADRIPVSLSLGLWSSLLVYLISIPLGIMKASRQGATFDKASSFILIILNSIPAFIIAIALIVFFAGGRYFSWFPLRGLVSPNFEELSLGAQILDYASHIFLPTLASSLGAFAGLAFLTKNAFIEHSAALYVAAARAQTTAAGNARNGVCLIMKSKNKRSNILSA